jgi:ATP-dependent Clp protease ATP-binding subunit ClpC
MLKRTPRVDRTIQRAESIAQSYGHDFIGTEHLLLALSHDRDGIAGRVLSDLGVSHEVEERVRAIIASESYNRTGPPHV